MKENRKFEKKERYKSDKIRILFLYKLVLFFKCIMNVKMT